MLKVRIISFSLIIMIGMITSFTIAIYDTPFASDTVELNGNLPENESGLLISFCSIEKGWNISYNIGNIDESCKFEAKMIEVLSKDDEGNITDYSVIFDFGILDPDDHVYQYYINKASSPKEMGVLFFPVDDPSKNTNDKREITCHYDIYVYNSKGEVVYEWDLEEEEKDDNTFEIIAMISIILFGALICTGLGLSVAAIIYKFTAQKIERNENIESNIPHQEIVSAMNETLRRNGARIVNIDDWNIFAVHGNQVIAHLFGVFVPDSAPIAIFINLRPGDTSTNCRISVIENPLPFSSTFLARNNYQKKVDYFTETLMRNAQKNIKIIV